MSARSTLWRVGWRYLLRHPWQSALMILGITLGVAVVIAVDLANASASRAFDLSTSAVTGRATHQLVGGPEGVPASLYTTLRRAALVNAAAPVLTAYVSSLQLGQVPMQLLGVDPFAEAPFRDYLGGRRGQAGESRPTPTTGDLAFFLTQPGAILISRPLAERYQLQACPSGPPPGGTQACVLQLDIGGKTQTVFIAGLIEPADALSERGLNGLLVADIATVQELTGRYGQLDHIDLILPADVTDLENDPRLQGLRQLLPQGVQLAGVAARSGAVAQMTAAFRVNLTALSLLALVVGIFLIYNTMTFTVVQRRPMFGTLRCLGATREEVFFLVMSEAFLVGALGAVLGTALGLLLGQGAVRLVTQTINDLFFVVTVRGVQIPLDSLLKGAALGILATLFTAAPPAWEAASVPPRSALSRSGLELKAGRAVNLAAVLGLVLQAAGGLVLFIPTRSLVVSFAGTFAVIVGIAMLAPVVSRLLMRVAQPVFGLLWGTLGRMAPRNAANSLSRTSIAVAALMVAVSVTIGVSVMVSSFRSTVVEWLNQTLQGDVYISTLSLSASAPTASLDPQLVETVYGWPGIARVDTLRSVTINADSGPLQLAATDNLSVAEERLFLRYEGPRESLWARMLAGGVLISEPLANRLALPVEGAQLRLETPNGLQDFSVLGVFYDYGSPQGTVIMARETYLRLWSDDTISAIALRLSPGQDADQVANALEAALAPLQKVLVRPNQALRQDALVVFDRTFAITGALQILATLVAFIGVLSALMSLELERQRELGILRSIGLTVQQLWRLILLETGLLGGVAGLLAMPTGYILALILVYIINRRSFGWTLQMQVQPQPFLTALLLALGAALLAGLYPAWRMGRLLAAEALRSE